MKKSILASSILALLVASAANAGQTFDTAAGSLSIGGDVEFNYESNNTSNLTSGGDVTIVVKGERLLDNNAYAGFSVATEAGLDGNVTFDDRKFVIGQKNDWSLALGAFEATNLSPAGADMSLTTSGAVSGYNGGKARGRAAGSEQTQVTFNKEAGALGYELTASSQDSGDLVILRPIVTYSAAKFSLAVGAEVPVVDTQDHADWTGYAATGTFEASDMVSITLRAATRSGTEFDTVTSTIVAADNMTAGVGVGIQNFYLGAELNDNSTDTETSLYTAYKIPAIMDIDNLDFHLGAGYAFAPDSANDVTTVKFRVKYIF
ncbi:hypothetical protein CXF72_08235 [Psychromonas sp. MB-3u-54]|uniref:carbohydrate porin n=1 Tax=Psychromonas sp. MB-3u-54 TaxID=2058319 RepID=UPI000C34D709|nr:carbohydrate porin [Psychromonas sp. MB-3u-54]PKH03066.1 hypothetical protein CXF72_08235 [Psychromonas sp. MB-3u-54]